MADILASVVMIVIAVAGVLIFWVMLAGGGHEDDIDARWGRGSTVDEWMLEREQTKKGWVKPLEPNVPTEDPDAPALVANPKKPDSAED